MLNKKCFNPNQFILTKWNTTANRDQGRWSSSTAGNAIAVPAMGLKRTAKDYNHLCTVNGFKMTLINYINFNQVLDQEPSLGKKLSVQVSFLITHLLRSILLCSESSSYDPISKLSSLYGDCIQKCNHSSPQKTHKHFNSLQSTITPFAVCTALFIHAPETFFPH